MARPSDRSPERKLQVVLSVLCGELTAAEAARRGGVSEQTVQTGWRSPQAPSPASGHLHSRARVLPAGIAQRTRVPEDRSYQPCRRSNSSSLHTDSRPRGTTIHNGSCRVVRSID